MKLWISQHVYLHVCMTLPGVCLTCPILINALSATDQLAPVTFSHKADPNLCNSHVRPGPCEVQVHALFSTVQTCSQRWKKMSSVNNVSPFWQGKLFSFALRVNCPLELYCMQGKLQSQDRH